MALTEARRPRPGRRRRRMDLEGERLEALALWEEKRDAGRLVATAPYRRASASCSHAAEELHRAARAMTGVDHALMMQIAGLAAAALAVDVRLAAAGEQVPVSTPTGRTGVR
jgi:hypothetical protein